MIKTIGILGGGQLGRMTALAAHNLGIQSIPYTDQENSPASQVCAKTFVGDYRDKDLLCAFAGQVDVITYEFENIPFETVVYLESLKRVYPTAATLKICQDRGLEKIFLRDNTLPTARFDLAKNVNDIQKALESLKPPVVLKTLRDGYDGKGQVIVKKADLAEEAFHSLGAKPVIIEEFIAFEREVSVIVCRDQSGHTCTYPVVENQHENHILKTTLVPAPISPETAEVAKKLAEKIAIFLNLVGVLAVEMFVKSDGSILINEMAPRPHNSGHWSIEGARTSQFEQLVRILAGLPMGYTDYITPCRMDNLLGAEVNSWQNHLDKPATYVHLYGKGSPKPGRKMGHVTTLLPSK